MKEPGRILLVDDSELDVELMLEAFRQTEQPSCVQACRSGEAALKHLQAQLEESAPLPSLILLDVKMPGMRGHEVLQQIRQDPRLQRIPVVMMTNSKEESDIARCYELGANSYIVKPISFEDLIRLARIIERYWLQVNTLGLQKAEPARQDAD